MGHANSGRQADALKETTSMVADADIFRAPWNG